MPGVTMSSQWQKQAIGRLLRDSIIQLCKSNHIYGGQVEVDGIICITGKAEGQELVVKVHERLSPVAGRLPITHFVDRGHPEPWSTSYKEEDAEDYSLKRRRLDDSRESHRHNQEADSYPHLKQHLLGALQRPDFDSLCAKDLSTNSSGVIEISPTSPPSGRVPEQGFSANADSSISPQNSGLGDSGRGSSHFLSSSASGSPSPTKYHPYTSTPHSIFPKRIPLRTDRWSPNQPIPTVPECKPCGYTFASFDILSDHNESVHSVFTCQSCFKTFTSRSNLERHSRLHTGHKPYTCTICGKSFSRKDHLSNHATKHAFKCGTCSKRFADKKMLVTHYSYDHNAILTNICDFCNKGFSSNESYEEHVKIHPQYHHSGSGKYDDGAGPDCSPRSHSSSPVPQPKFVCKSCGFSTEDKLTLLKHKIVHSDNARCYTCLSCAKMFDDPLRYGDHLLIHQQDTNIFECTLCRQICMTLQSLHRHEIMHIGDITDEPEEMFRCHKCRRRFRSQNILDEHLEMHQQMEEQQQDYMCGVCNQEFSSYPELCHHIDEEGHYNIQSEATPSENGDVQSPSPSRKDKRKQKVPKSVRPMDTLDDEVSDIEVVEPESPEDEEPMPLMLALTPTPGDDKQDIYGNNSEYVITENQTPVTEVNAEKDSSPIKMGPVKSLLSRTIMNRAKDKVTSNNNNGEAKIHDSPQKMVCESSPPAAILPSDPQESPLKLMKREPSAAMSPPNNNNSLTISPKLVNVDIPAGPYNCAICSATISNFQELEMHCFSEHNRSPCMFCSKTFAQKANRDRHVCLHTGEKPYSCPDCDEKFSRGDKLKIHRVRAHKAQYPMFSNRGGGSSASRELSISPSPSAAGSQDSLGKDDWTGGYTNSSMYGGGEWRLRNTASPDGPLPYVHAGGEWSVREQHHTPEPLDLHEKHVNGDKKD